MQIIILIFLLILSAFFAGIEIAFFSLSEIDVRRMIEAKKKNAQLVAKLKSNPQKLLSVVSIGNNLVNISASAMATVLATNYFGDSGVSIAVGVMTLLILVFCEITPKSISAVYSNKIARLSARPLSIISFILTPLIIFFEVIHKFVNKIFKSTKLEDFEDDVKVMTAIGVEKGRMERGEKEMIERIFDFKDISAEDVMTVRQKIVAWSAKDTIENALPYLMEASFSRVPIFDKDLDNIVGIVFMKDVLKAVADNNRSLQLKDIAHKPYFLPLSRKIDDLLKDFQKKRLHMGIVIDEFGTVQGVVTMEDLLEELVGEIIDETDTDEHLIKRIDKKTILVNGEAEVEDVNDFFHTNFSAGKGDSMAWLVLDKIGEIPEIGQEIMIGEVKLIIEDADEKRIKKIKIIKL
jgi:CBS domain containing-hemolysin-like protein